MSEDQMTSVECTEITEVISSEDPIIHLTENGVVGFEVLCRLCANRSDHLIPIYSEEGISNDLADKMNLYLPVKVTKNDLLPLQCCFQCASTVLTWHELVIASIEADKRLRDVQAEVEKQLAEQNAEIEAENEAGPSQQEHEKIFIQEDGLSIASSSSTVIITKLEHEQEQEQFDSYTESTSNEELEDDMEENTYELSLNTTKTIKNEFVYDKTPTENIKRPRRKKTEITPRFFCDVCSKGFTRKHDVKKHRERIHKNVPKEDEQDVGMKLANQQRLQLLQRCKIVNEDGTKCYKCETCNKLISLSYNFIRHQSVHTGARPFFCHICGKSFRMSSTLYRHIKEFHYRIKRFTCDICNKKFAAKASLDDHLNIHSNSRPFGCETCGKSFKQKASLNIHKLFHTNNFRFSCSICGKKYRRARDLKVHSWLHTGYRPYSCKICGNLFRLPQGLKRHMKVHDKNDRATFTCDQCGANFIQMRYLKTHMKTH